MSALDHELDAAREAGTLDVVRLVTRHAPVRVTVLPLDAAAVRTRLLARAVAEMAELGDVW